MMRYGMYWGLLLCPLAISMHSQLQTLLGGLLPFQEQMMNRIMLLIAALDFRWKITRRLLWAVRLRSELWRCFFDECHPRRLWTCGSESMWLGTGIHAIERANATCSLAKPQLLLHYPCNSCYKAVALPISTWSQIASTSSSNSMTL